MKALELLRRWKSLTASERDYAIEYLSGAMALGEAMPDHKDKAHADWAKGEFERAINEALKS